MKDKYDQLVENPNAHFIQMPDGQLCTLDEAKYTAAESLHIFSGSYNPLHEGHKAIYKSIDSPNKMFEISLARVNKFTLTLEELKERLKQFEWYAPVLVTNQPKFVEKAGTMYPRQPVFHIGYDTALRISEQHSQAEIQGMRCMFVVYPRKWNASKPPCINVKMCGIQDLRFQPANFLPGPELPEAYWNMSSTQIRASQK